MAGIVKGFVQSHVLAQQPTGLRLTDESVVSSLHGSGVCKILFAYIIIW
jgi:hypothetical protein